MKKKKKQGWLDTLVKKINNAMAGFDIDELMSIKNAYQGQRFQWIKPDDKKRLAQVVTVTDIIPGKRMNTVNGPVQQYRAILSDGLAIDTESLTNNLMMLHEDQQPMSMIEVLSIYQEPSLELTEIVQQLPSDLKEYSDLPKQSVNPINMPISELKTLDPNNIPQPRQKELEPAKQPKLVNTKTLFGMFEVKDTDVLLKVKVPLPSKNLLKMMFANSQNTDEFIEQLATHINSNITLDSIKESVTKLMGQNKNKHDFNNGE